MPRWVGQVGSLVGTFKLQASLVGRHTHQTGNAIKKALPAEKSYMLHHPVRFPQ